MTHLRFGVVPPLARRADAIVIGGIAGIGFLVGAMVWPLFPGRDAQTYLMYYLEMGRADPVFPLLMLFRTPGAPLFFGPPLVAGYPVAAEVMLGALFVVAIISVYLTGAFWSRRIGIATAVVVMLYPPYHAIYHQLSSDGMFAFAVAVWALLFVAAAREPTTRKFLVLGCYVFVLTMIRPASLVFLGFIALLVFVAREPLLTRLRHVAIAIVAGGLLHAGWAGYNGVRYGDFTISRLAPINVPFFRLFMLDRLIRPENGPASRELANAVASDLLPREPYRSYGVTVDHFFTKGHRLLLFDLIPMSDRVWGWDTDYEIINRVSREAIARHPAAYAKGVAKGVLTTLTDHNYAPKAAWPPVPRTIRCELACIGKGTVVRNGLVLPAPYYPDETIPQAHSYWLESTPDSSISTDWSDLYRPRLAFTTAEKERAFTELSAGVAKALENLPPRQPVVWPRKVANLMSELLPPMWVWLLLGVAGLAWKVRFDRRLLVMLPVMAVAFTVITAMGLPPSQEYRLPFDPMMILFGIAGFFGVRRPDDAA